MKAQRRDRKRKAKFDKIRQHGRALKFNGVLPSNKKKLKAEAAKSALARRKVSK